MKHILRDTFFVVGAMFAAGLVAFGLGLLAIHLVLEFYLGSGM